MSPSLFSHGYELPWQVLKSLDSFGSDRPAVIFSSVDKKLVDIHLLGLEKEVFLTSMLICKQKKKVCTFSLVRDSAPKFRTLQDY